MTKINPKKYYTLYEIALNNLFKIDSDKFQTIKGKTRYMILMDRVKGNILDASTTPDPRLGGQIRYAVLGQNIINFNKFNRDNNKNTRVKVLQRGRVRGRQLGKK
jgi:hypothetical protein